MPETVIINLLSNFSNETSEKLAFFNKIIISNSIEKGNQYLDIAKSKKFLKAYTDELSLLSNEYFQGF
ncbi:hypothetical protein ACQ9BO_22050 [Flavobacterium sp. P21]|uniref:hypothetical protein n=1 Tax=Flavobacterium sp. P21 TaxID=3423948 RepID=UPI003D668C64